MGRRRMSQDVAQLLLMSCPFRVIVRESSLSYDMEGHAQKCVEHLCELAHMTTDHLHKVPTRCLDDHEKNRRSGSCARVVRDQLSIVLKMLVFGKNWSTMSTLDTK